jgi:PAS domain-containing protein
VIEQLREQVVPQLGPLVLVTDLSHPDRRVVAVSDELALVLGYEPGDLVGASWELSEASPETRAAVVARLDQLGLVSGECRLVAADGRRVPFAYTTMQVGGLTVSILEPMLGSGLELVIPDPPGLRIVPAVEPGEGLGPDVEPYRDMRWAMAYTGRGERAIAAGVERGEIPRAGTPGKRAFKQSWLDAWMLGGGALLMLAVLVAAALLGLASAGVDVTPDTIFHGWEPFAARVVEQPGDLAGRLEAVLDRRQEARLDARQGAARRAR